MASATSPQPVRASGILLFGIASLCAALLLGYISIWWTAVTPVRQAGSDYSAAYTAALVLRDGKGEQLYDQALEDSYHRRLLPAGIVADEAFRNPPTAALL